MGGCASTPKEQKSGDNNGQQKPEKLDKNKKKLKKEVKKKSKKGGDVPDVDAKASEPRSASPTITLTTQSLQPRQEAKLNHEEPARSTPAASSTIATVPTATVAMAIVLQTMTTVETLESDHTDEPGSLYDTPTHASNPQAAIDASLSGLSSTLVDVATAAAAAAQPPQLLPHDPPATSDGKDGTASLIAPAVTNDTIANVTIKTAQTEMTMANNASVLDEADTVASGSLSSSTFSASSVSDSSSNPQSSIIKSRREGGSRHLWACATCHQCSDMMRESSYDSVSPETINLMNLVHKIHHTMHTDAEAIYG